MPVCTQDRVAPEELEDCTKGWCGCRKNNVHCTDLCGCGDKCENTDAPPPAGVSLNEDSEMDNDEVSEEGVEMTEEEREELEEFLKQVDEDLEG